MGARSAVATVAWLATDHQQLMYLLSPEGKTVFYIPGVEVVHKVSTPINLPEESNKIKMEPGKMQPPPGGSRKRAAGLSLDLNSASVKRNKQVQSLLTSPTCRCSSSPPRSLRSSSSRTPPSPPPPPLATSSQSLCRRSRPCTPKALRRLSSICANLSHPAQTIWRLRTPLPPLVQLPWDHLAETWRCIELCPSHIEALTCSRAYQRRNKTKEFPSLCKPLPILDLLQGLRGRTTPRPTKCLMESRLRTSLMII